MFIFLKAYSSTELTAARFKPSTTKVGLILCKWLCIECCTSLKTFCQQDFKHYCFFVLFCFVLFFILQEESYHMIADTVEMDEINSHECMTKIRALLKHLLENKISPVPTMVRNVYRFQSKGFILQVSFRFVFVRTMISGVIDIIISFEINCSGYREQLLLTCQVGCPPYTRSSLVQTPI